MPSTRTFAAGLAAAAALLVPAAAHAAPGELDPTFDGDGRLTADFGKTETGDAAVYQPDGKLLVAGQTRAELAGNFAGDFVVLRYNTDGTPDKTFDGDGRIAIPFGPRDNATAIALQPDGKIVVAGSTNSDEAPATGTFSFAVARLDTSGHLDPLFNNGIGRAVVDFGAQDLAAAVTIQPDGKIVVAGDTFGGGNSSFAWARLKTDGTPDSTFDGDGRTTLNKGGSESATAVAIAPDGKVVTAGLTTANSGGGRDFGIVRLTQGGVPDGSFDGDGFAQVGFTDSDGANDDVAGGVGVRPDGSVLVGGRSLTLARGDFTAAKLTPGGALDPAYGDGGRARIDSPGYEVALEAAVQPDGELVLAGSTLANSAFADFTAAALLPDGRPDPRFAGGHPITVDFAQADTGNGVATREGALAIAGTTGGAGSNIGVAQVLLPRPGDPLPEPAQPDQDPAPGQPTQDPGVPPAQQPPARDTTAPVVARLRLKPSRFRARRGTRGSFTLTEPARVTLTIQRKRGRRFVKAGAIKVTGKAGTNRFKLRKVRRHRLARGAYRIVATAVDPVGNRSTGRRARFRVVR